MRSYEAILIDSSLSSGRHAGLLTLFEDRVEFESNLGKITIFKEKLQVNAGGAGNRLIFLSDKDINEVSIYTGDKKVLKDPFLVNFSHLKNQLKSSKRIVSRIYYATFCVILFFLILIFSTYFLKDKFVEKLAEKVPLEWEKKAGDKLFTALSAQYKIIECDSLKKVFLHVAKPLIDQIERKGVKIELYFVQDPRINAFALPGGKVVIQSGLLDNAKSWEEVLGVLGHELAHVTRRHHLRGIINNVGLYTILAASFGDISALAGTVVNMGGELASLSNSRVFETEADETGWDYLVQAKIDPQGMISFFETLDKDNHSKIAENLSFMSTHPETKERIKNLKMKMKKNPVHFKLINNNFKTFKSSFNLKK